MGDILPIPDLNVGVGLTTSYPDEYSTIGNNLIKCITDYTKTYDTCSFGQIITNNTLSGKTVKFEVDYKVFDDKWNIIIGTYSPNYSQLKSVTLDKDNNTGFVQVVLPANTTKIWIRLRSNTNNINSTIFSDNWRLTIIE